MKKNTLIILMVAVVAVIGIAAAVMMMTGDGNDDTKDGKIYSVTLEVAQEDGAYKEYAATGMNVKDILTKTLGDDIVLKSNGNVQSYKNKENTIDESWIVFRWQSLKGWVPAKDTDLRDDSTLVLEYTKKITNNGKTEYVQPGFSISNEVYFFIQIPNMSEIEKIAKDPNSKSDDKSEGKVPLVRGGGGRGQRRSQLQIGWRDRSWSPDEQGYVRMVHGFPRMGGYPIE